MNKMAHYLKLKGTALFLGSNGLMNSRKHALYLLRNDCTLEELFTEIKSMHPGTHSCLASFNASDFEVYTEASDGSAGEA